MSHTGPDERLKILVLAVYDGTDASAIGDYLISFRLHSRHHYYYVFNGQALEGRIDLTPFDVILIFWNVDLLGPDLSASLREQIARAPGLKVVFLQDEHRDVRSVNRVLAEIGAQVIFTCVAEADHEIFYPAAVIPGLEGVYTVLPGYVPRDLEQAPLDVETTRPIDVGYRSRAVPFHLGDVGQEKATIAERFQALAPAGGLTADISVLERDRLYGRQWLTFLKSCRSVLGTRSGASVADFTGEIRRACARYLALYPEAAYGAVKARFFADVDGAVVIDTVSPRIFEAVALGCTLVHHEGRYAGLLQPEEHYICVRRDYGNTAEVLDRLRDRHFCREMARRAHRDLIASGRYSFASFAHRFDGILDKHVRAPRRTRSVSPARFYAEAYLCRGQAMLPWGRRLVVAPSAQLVQHLVRLGLARLPRRRRGPLFSRLIHNPGGIGRKAWAAWRLLWRHPTARRIVIGGLRSAQARRAVGLQELLDDLLRLEIMRAVSADALSTRQPFVLRFACEESAPSTLVATSVADGPNARADVAARPSTLAPWSPGVADALRRGQVRAIVWDHSAVAPQVTVRAGRGPWLTYPMGAGGAYRFRALERLYRADPGATGRAALAILVGSATR